MAHMALLRYRWFFAVQSTLLKCRTSCRSTVYSYFNTGSLVTVQIVLLKRRWPYCSTGGLVAVQMVLFRTGILVTVQSPNS